MAELADVERKRQASFVLLYVSIAGIAIGAWMLTSNATGLYVMGVSILLLLTSLYLWSRYKKAFIRYEIDRGSTYLQAEQKYRDLNPGGD